MPIVNGRNISGDEALSLGRCPECGELLERDTARSHAENHWFSSNPNDPKLSEEAQRRFKLILDFAQSKPAPPTPESGDTAPTNDKAVLGFCELWALFFALPAGEALYRGESMNLRMMLFAGIGSVFAILGPAWPSVKSKFPRRFSVAFVRTASDFRWWAAILLVGFAVTALFDQKVSEQRAPKSDNGAAYSTLKEFFAGSTWEKKLTQSGDAVVPSGHADAMAGVSLSRNEMIPASAATASVSIPLERPYRVDDITTSWGSGVTIANRADGIDVAFASPAPANGGQLHWSAIAGDASPQIQVFPKQSLTPSPAQSDVARSSDEATMTIINSPKNWQNIPSGPWAGPLGPILAVELLDVFQQLPKPCAAKVTAPHDNENLRATMAWILQYGAKCEIVGDSSGLPNADEPRSAQVLPNTNAGIVVHWSSDYPVGGNVAHWFDTSTFKVSTSLRLPPNSDPHLVWIDVGPGSPWKMP
jgi:hypothetical protein